MGIGIPILEDDPNIFAYVRSYNNEKLLVANNFFGKEASFKVPEELKLQGESRILISNYDDARSNIKDMVLRPYESIVYYIK